MYSIDRMICQVTDRTTGPAWPIDDAWRTTISAKMAAMGISRAELARMCGVSRQTIQAVFLFAN